MSDPDISASDDVEVPDAGPAVEPRNGKVPGALRGADEGAHAGTVSDARLVRSWGTLALLTAPLVLLIALLFTRELPLSLIGVVLILAMVGVGLRIEAAIRLRDR
ncbi:hypothetical protein DQ384_09115 [Sphaerisporangium album]|uniref:Uncharacterized protein n=1 Tax=Sphaerisporangium album TaxID=509200 RepID=A0A367FPR4_9ACTN|nr:hypothetical protein [Sphaerisporangium album]RCG31697.1 hypothetical protein DQ384_09115 [Sphaerisporangium album]